MLDVSFTTTDGTKISLISDMNYTSFHADISSQPVTLSVGDLSSGKVIDVTETLGSGTLKGTLDFLNKSGDFDNSDFKGLGYYEKAFDSLVETFATALNEANKAVKLDANGKPIENPPGSGQYEMEDRPLFEQIDPNKPFSASNIKLADNWVNGTYGVTNSTDVIDGKIGATANDSVLNMIKLFDSDLQFKVNGNTFFTGSFTDCFKNIESTLGVDKKSAETMVTNQIAVLNQTANSRDGVSGVQLDEEGMNLMHFNQSYTAATRLMTTLDEALDTLINRTGVVGR